MIDNHTLHGSLPNESESDLRWSVSLRYQPAGQPSGRPYLPGFVVRSRKNPSREFRSGEQWSAMWRAALLHVESQGDAIPRASSTGLLEARVFSREWHRRTPDPAAWLSLGAEREPAPSLGRKLARKTDYLLGRMSRIRSLLS